MRTLIAGGGTGGHLTPALALAQELRRTDPAGSVLLVSRRGGVAMELVAAAQVAVETIDVRGVDMAHPLSVASALARMPVAVVEARRILLRFRPDVVVGTAGYVCVPVVLAAFAAGVPVVLLEQNAIPGRAVRLLSRRARAVATSYRETAAHLPWARCVHTGNPVRPEIAADAPAPLGVACRSVLVTGGSQGARRINEAVIAGLEGLLRDNAGVTVTHQCGRLDGERARSAAAALPADLRPRYTVEPFFEDLGSRIRAADLVVMRAGGSSLAEVSVLGRPMLLVPYPHAGGHQRFNALPYVDAGAARLVADEELTGERLRTAVTELVRDPAGWRAMGEASARAGRPGAAGAVAGLLAEVAA